MANLLNCLYGFLLVTAAASCKGGTEKNATDEPVADVRTPVTVTQVSHDSLEETVEITAVSSFLQKSYVKANANGYLQSVNTYVGRYVNKGQVLFTLKTKEAQSIGNTINALDSSFRFSGVNHIPANDNGYITQLNHQNGDYVQDGEQLAVISDMNSFVFLLNLPYELRPYLARQGTIALLLPDGQQLQGSLAASMPVMDSASQTQNIVIRVHPGRPIPENLIARVKLVKAAKANAVSLPRAAVLSDETLSSFWIMKLADSTTAIKVPITKGMETKDRVEILSPVLTDKDRVLLTGNYGLGDTAKIKIEQ